LKQFSTANLNNFQRINLLKFYTILLMMTFKTIGKKLWKSDVEFLGEGCMGSKKLLPHISALKGPSSICESIQAREHLRFIGRH